MTRIHEDTFTGRHVHPRTTAQRATFAAGLALAVGIAGLPASTPVLAAVQTSAENVRRPSTTLVSSRTYPIPAGFRSDARLLVHTMPSITGQATAASTLLFVPRGTPPAGGWPIVVWGKGTTTPGQKTCAPSLTPEDLDGGLTRDGFKSDYAFQLGRLVNAGYAVVAPDLEGLGPVATVRHPYYVEASFARSLIAGVRAAREAEPALSNRVAAFGHSEGGHGALSVEGHIGEAPELTLVGTIASAPYVAIAAHAATFGERARNRADPKAAAEARVNEQFQVMLMAVGASVQSPGFDPGTVVGADLERVLPAFRAACSVPSIAVISGAIDKGGASFDGLKPGWAETPRMGAFLAANDFGVTPGFTLRRPTLIVQGGKDPLVLEPLTTAFVGRLRATGAPIAYKRYPGADHFTIIRQADADVLAFLRDRFRR